MDTVKNHRGGDGRSGFTLIELAIVLIIIGLIIGAVLKGQDLITNARAKRVTSFLRQAEVAQWSYYDRNGVFATNSTGSTDSLSSLSDFNSQLSLGSSSLQVLVGEDSATTARAVIVLAKNSGATTTLNDDEVVWAQILDSTIDGTSNPASGSIIAVTAVTADGTNGGISAITNSTLTTWTAGTHTGIAYYYDQ